MKKRILSILLTLCMVLMLVPATAFAETLIGDIDRDGDVTVKDAVCLQNYLDGLISFTDEELRVADFNGDGRVNYTDLTELQSYLDFMKSSIAVTVNGFEVGNTPNDITYSFASTIPGVEFSEDDIQSFGWAKYRFIEDQADYQWDYMPETEAFEAGVRYRIEMNLDNKGLNTEPAVTVNGRTPYYCKIATSNGAPIQLQISCDLGTPAEPGSLAITVDGFEVGKTPNDVTLSFASTIPGVTFSADDIQRCSWDQYTEGEWGDKWSTMSIGEVFQADTRYKCYIDLGNNGLMEAPAVTVNGKTPEYCVIATSDGKPYALLIECELGTPALPPITLTVPFTTTVKLGGSTAPGETTFELAVVGANAGEESYKDVTVSASVTTNGAGSYEGTMTFKGTFQQLQNMLGAGVFVQQVNAGAPNWTYDDTVWGLYLKNFAELAADDAAPEYTVLIFPATCEKTDNGMFYSMVDGANAVARMIFTNTYTYSAPVRDTTTIVIGGEKEENKPVEENPNTGAPVAANMSTLSVLTVAAAAVAVLKMRKR